MTVVLLENFYFHMCEVLKKKKLDGQMCCVASLSKIHEKESEKGNY